MKLVSDPVIRSYELTYLVPTSKTTAEQSVFAETIVNEIKSFGGSVVSQDEWGKRELAYTIKYNKARHQEAVYFHVVFNMEAEKVPEFEKKLNLNQDLLRHLLVQAETQET